MTGSIVPTLYHTKLTIPASGWSTDAAPYTQTIALAGLSVNEYPVCILDFDTITADNYEEYQGQFSCITRIITENNSMVCYAHGEAPTIDLPILIKR